MKKSTYSDLSTIVYNKTKPPGTTSDGDIAFYKSQLLSIEGKILEAGVGNGRMSIPLLKYGLEIDGIDLSDEMLEIYKQNLSKENLTAKIIKMNLIDYISPNTYEAIIMPTGSICMIEKIEDLNTIFKNYYESLVVGGKIIIDFIYPTTFMPGSKHLTEIIIDDSNLIKLEINHNLIDWSKQIAYSNNTYIHLQNGKEINREEQTFNLRWYSENEIQMIAKSIGFSDIEIIKNYKNIRILNLNTITLIAKK